MRLTSWEQYPDGKIQKYEVSIAKNYLSKEGLQALDTLLPSKSHNSHLVASAPGRSSSATNNYSPGLVLFLGVQAQRLNRACQFGCAMV
ncbi:hypothetical protein B5E56_09665 [Flavonifractor sp. An112]|nr:hypothetical protein B5E56_09665 [Flavonifractor sp. An112]